MSIDYKKELEQASKTMILVHEPKTLIKLIVRTIVQKVKVSHAGILLYDQSKQSYILTVSRGPIGLRIPEGLTRMDIDNPLIRFFRERRDKLLFDRDTLVYNDGLKLADQVKDSILKQLLCDALYQMEIFETAACIPSYFRDDLLGILLLGKKQDGTSLGEDEMTFFIALAQDVAMAIRNAQLFSDLKAELDSKRALFDQTTSALATAIEAKDNYTHGHTNRVTFVSEAIAKKLGEKNKHQVDDKFNEDIHIAALLHDIGKIGIPEAILNKEGPLDEEERKKIKEHSEIGVKILKSIPDLHNPILGVKYHHERYDGKGYPDGLKGEEIPLIAAIISVADAFDAMISDRPYRKGMDKNKAVEEIKHQSGLQFDPQVVSAFMELFQEGKI